MIHASEFLSSGKSRTIFTKGDEGEEPGAGVDKMKKNSRWR